MGNRTEYQREYQRRRRAADPAAALAESRRGYVRVLEREAGDPCLRVQRLRKARAWRQAHRDRLRYLSRLYYDRIRGDACLWADHREQNRQGQARYRERPEHRQKLRARWTAQKAVERGRLRKQACSDCGRLPAQMHHADYARPLEVTWLCRHHHEAAHHGTV